MGFCGPSTGALNVETGVLANECYVDVLNIIPHSVFFLISVSILVAWRHSFFGKLDIVTWVHFQGHTLRWIILLGLFSLNIVEIAEGVLLASLDTVHLKYHVFIPQCIATISTGVSIAYYHSVEMWNSPRFLILLLLYWSGSLTCKILKIVSVTWDGVELTDVRFWLTLIGIIFYALLLVIELNVLRIQRYTFFKEKNLLQPLDEIAETRYIYCYVNFLSKATFWWILGLLREGYKHALDLQHLGRLPVTEHTKTNLAKLHRAFEEEKIRAGNHGGEPSLTRSYLKAFWPMLALAGLFKLMGDLLGFVGPWFIESIVDYAYATRDNLLPHNLTHNATSDSYVHVDSFVSNGYVLSATMFFTCLLQKSFLQNHHYLVIREAIRLKNSVQGMVYEKALRLSTLMLSSDKLSVGHILNYMSTDAYFLHNLFFMIHYVWAVPVQMTIAFVLMYLKLGISAVIGASVVVLVVPFQYIVARSLSKLQKKIMHYSDERMKKTTELINGIRALKLFTWETLFCKRVEAMRKEEMKFILRHSLLLGLMDFITVGTPIAGMLITFSVHALVEEEPMTAGRVFSTVALFNVFLLPLFTFTLVLHNIVNARVSAKRIVPYLTAPEAEGLVLHDDHMTSEAVQVATEDGNEQVEIGHDLSVRFQIGSGKFQTSAARKRSEDSHRGHQRNSSTDKLHTPMKKIRKHSAPPRMITGVEARKHKGMRPKPSSNSLNASHLVPMDPGRKSCQSSSSSVDKNESGMTSDPESDTEHPIMVSSSVSTEDVSDVKAGDSVVEVRNAVEVKGGNFCWEFDSDQPFLKNISMKVPVGKLTCVIGQVGSGKSSLLSALLGEMITLSGTLEWCRGTKIAYVAQKPWILNTSLRNNILAGQPFVWKKYKRILAACALNTDIEMLPAGDLTEIGEKGINLSGGQKQRVTIARALYSEANTILLDDPLSALDSHVAKHVFNTAIIRRLVRKRHTVILVTHAVQYLCRAHHIIVMKDGKVKHEGSLGDIKKADPELYESWRLTLREAKKKEESEQRLRDSPESMGGSRPGSDTEQVKLEVESHSRRGSLQSQGMRLLGVASGRQLSKLSVMTEASSEDGDCLDNGDSTTGQLIKEEHKESGSVSRHIYFSFLRACSLWLVLLLVIFKLVRQSLVVAADYWLSVWAGHVDTVVRYNTTGSQELTDKETGYYIHVYFVLCVSAVLITLITTLAEQFVIFLAARRLHLRLLRNIILSPVRFFDTTPSGRILNRFSADTASIDLKMGQRVAHLTRSVLGCVAGVVVITMSTPYFLLLVIPLTALYIMVQKFYLATSRELQRLDSLTKSPLFSHFSETLNGLQTIRAFGHQRAFLEKALLHIDTNTIPYLFLHTVNRVMGIFLDYMGSLIVFAAAVFSLTSALHGSTEPAFVGMSITYALLMCDGLNWAIRCASDVELQMNAVERIKEYSELPQEPYNSSGYIALQSDEAWPTAGEICFSEVSVRYAKDLEPVLRKISFTIKAGEKVGLCGRTGSGKTSLTSSLFRVVDIHEGSILIDGKDITKIPLTRLRSAITAIPQDPLLFSGSVRYNLDPEGLRDDEEIWAALDMAQLKNTVTLITHKLDGVITEGGENFSVGQRQLFCFARALLRKSQILILDEATASVDSVTDSLIQDVIAKAFTGKTVITVAHRISTIESYDKVLVLDDGELVEMGSPAALLSNQDSFFYRLARQNKA